MDFGLMLLAAEDEGRRPLRAVLAVHIDCLGGERRRIILITLSLIHI